MPTHSANQPLPMKAVRLIFEYDGDQVRLVSQQPVDVAGISADLVQAGTSTALAQTTLPGFYVDSRDTRERTLVRVAAPNAFASSVEVFPEQPGEPIFRVEVARPQGAFAVVVPTPPDADHVTVVQITSGPIGAPQSLGGTTSPRAAQPQVVDLASFPLTSNP